MSAWEALLRRATVMVTAGGAEGTGFVVAPGLVATCAHVLARWQEPPPDRVHGRVVALDHEVELRLEGVHWVRSTGLDLALLRIVGDPLPPVLTSTELRTHDVLWTFGHPAGQFRGGQHASFAYQGGSRRSTDEVLELPRVYGMAVGPGYSGSPVVNLRTGAVCGMLSTSDKKGGAHLVPISEILARCEGAAPRRDWLSELTDEQLAAGGWRFPGPRLAAYLSAVVARSDEHPYPGVLPGVRPPPLSRVYVRQNARTVTMLDTDAQTPAIEIFEGDRDVLLIGGPGAGKSSLLRVGASRLAHAWLARRETDEDGPGQGIGVPVRVHASDIVHAPSLDAQMLSAVQADLGPRLRESPPSGFFSRPPMPGERWLVLVDGLDEVLDPHRQQDVIATLRHHGTGPYRFVVASRPSPGADLRVAGTVDTYELLPFSIDQLHDLARDWCSVSGLPEPEQAAREFVARTEGGRLSTLVRSPLLATMLCQLYIADPRRPLPTGRFGLYETFVDLLRERQYTGDAAGVIAQAREALEPYGTDPGGIADLPRRIFEVLPRLARMRWTDRDDRPLAEIAADWLGDLRPPAMRAPVWAELVRGGLRRTGLLTERGDDLVFLHQTLTEFLAAKGVADDRERSKREFERAYGRRGTKVPDEYLLLSFDLFMIAAWLAHPERAPGVGRFLHRLAKGREPGHLTLISMLIADGVPLPEATLRLATARLTQIVTESPYPTATSVHAGRALGELGDPLGAEYLYRSADEFDDVDAARALASLGDPRGLELLRRFVQSAPAKDLPLDAARALAEFGDPVGTEVLVKVATDPDGFGPGRIRAAEILHDGGDPRGLELLTELAADPAHDDDWGFEARVLARLRLPRHAEILTALADGPDHWMQYYAARQLASLSNPYGLEVLARLADTAPSRAARRNAKNALEVLREDPNAFGDP
ncbi:trypsin-like peptidase domain-containing protein [Actinomadura sp. SCN-SB]|uniref:trypsin-like peptidase domain-containing protein n=1 Tax=Actinomadura sp. SCN-SB TaxID=3373092 RepID=UPI003752AEAC